MNKNLKLIGLSVLCVTLLASCGSMNKITNDGQIANQDIRWGGIDNTTFKVDGVQPGMWKSKADLDLLQPGMTKSQIHALLGRPHYNEGFVGVREWNYVLNKNTPYGVKHCQLKITFDKSITAQQFLWNPVGCMVELPVEEPVVEKPVQKFNLRADFLFDFDKYTLKKDAHYELSKIVYQIKQNKIDEVVIVGHTDRLGSEEYNKTLSEKRAITVSKYMIDSGIPSYRIKAFGAGKTRPVKECQGTKATPQLKACLADNRRVEISVK